MTITPKPRGRHHHGSLRRALLDAVAEIVLEAGPDAVSLRECARRAGVSHSAAAPHFGDLRGLLTSFAIEGETRLARSMKDAVSALRPGADARARLAATGHGYMAFARENPAHFRLMVRTDLLDTADPAWRGAVRDAWTPLSDAMTSLVPGADERALRARLALAWTAVHGFCALRAEGAGGDLWNPEDRAKEVANDLIALIVAACAAPVDGAVALGAAPAA
ncbi:TetR/AcrR family transcriptional regulator [Roseomonas rosulenta]|uniref:TetR/AcrR family transcriptional regulator n=1 Tax=Roseomonas rosulenta TaxID=2748667 RepID=UPI0018E00F75|nr:TetR/AcrR family transcriptional regulator [Roseomonas rosulenta]